jgi:uncharacterized coiled-coil protein SlyX
MPTDEEMSTPKGSPSKFESTPTSNKKRRRHNSESPNATPTPKSDRDLLHLVLQKVEDMSKDLTLKIEGISEGWKTAIQKLEEKVLTQDKTIQQQQSQITQQNVKIDALERMVEDLFCKVNENHLVMSGVQYRDTATAHQEIGKIFKYFGAQRPPGITQIKELGNSRKLLVKFTNYGDKVFLFKSAQHLRNRGIGLEDDLPPSLLNDRNILLRRRRELIENGVARNVKVFKRELLVDENDWYTYDRRTGIMDKRPPRVVQNGNNRNRQPPLTGANLHPLPQSRKD